MTERTDPTGEDEIRHRDGEFSTDPDLEAEVDAFGAEMAGDLDVDHALPEPDTAPPPPSVSQYDTKKVPHGGSLTKKNALTKRG